MNNSDSKSISEKINTLARYCAYQERCKQDIMQKMFAIGVLPDEKEVILGKLIQEGFVNDLRYAQSFVRGKLRINHWGKLKIKAALFQKGIENSVIKTALLEIDEQEYKDIASNLVSKQLPKIKAKNDYEKKQKLLAFMAQRGFEYESYGS